ncbi:MAG TPA: TetR/AcrR family transcriptional regulator [Nitrospirales bacterium]|nr:TetR/AcrR family transcriptional regulator [Nitrospiraceae bacterium]HQU28247.1 TetR/AcrR family transcriptional regulator [Nitrospirales bacterium]
MSRSGQSSSTRLRAKDRQAEIIRAAALLFAEKGFNGTKTREISSEAGVSEALIFKHFPSKEDLYAAILAKESPVPQLISQVKDFAQNHNDEAVFRTIAETIVGGAPDDGLMRLILFSALESHELSDMFFQNHIRSFCDVLAGYIQQRIEDGAFREISPILAARAFMGMLIYHRLLTVLFQAPLSQDPREIAETFVTLMMTGVRRSRKKGDAARRPTRATARKTGPTNHRRVP